MSEVMYGNSVILVYGAFRF